MKLLQNCKLTYFGIPGRGESIRLALAYGGIPFEDDRVEFSSWKGIKASTPWGSLPVLTLASSNGSGGQVVAQQRAILRLVGTEVGLYPTSDPWSAALVDSLLDVCEDVGATINKQGQGLPQPEKEAARAAAVAQGGAVHGILTKLEGFCGQHGKEGHAVGNAMTIADIMLFCVLGGLVSGMFDGVPTNALDTGDFPNLTLIRKTVRAHPAITKWYDQLDPKYTMPPSYGPFN